MLLISLKNFVQLGRLVYCLLSALSTHRHSFPQNGPFAEKYRQRGIPFVWSRCTISQARPRYLPSPQPHRRMNMAKKPSRVRDLMIAISRGGRQLFRGVLRPCNRSDTPPSHYPAPRTPTYRAARRQHHLRNRKAQRIPPWLQSHASMRGVGSGRCRGVARATPPDISGRACENRAEPERPPAQDAPGKGRRRVGLAR